MALILVFHNDFKGDGELPEDSAYDVQVLVGDGTKEGSHLIADGRIEHHNRSDGWEKLVSTFLRQREVANWNEWVREEKKRCDET